MGLVIAVTTDRLMPHLPKRMIVDPAADLLKVSFILANLGFQETPNLKIDEMLLPISNASALLGGFECVSRGGQNLATKIATYGRENAATIPPKMTFSLRPGSIALAA